LERRAYTFPRHTFSVIQLVSASKLSSFDSAYTF